MSTVLPDPVLYGTVTGRFLIQGLDSADVDDLPDGVPAEGEVIFTPRVQTVLVTTSTPPITLFTERIRVPLVNGEFTTKLVATDIADASPTGWTYHVTYDFSNLKRQNLRFDIEVAAGSTVDLTEVTPVPSSPGVAEVITTADLIAAEAAADRAEAAASILENYDGIGYYELFADTSTTFPARSTVPSWWSGPVAYNSREFAGWSGTITDMEIGDIHRKRNI